MIDNINKINRNNVTKRSNGSGMIIRNPEKPMEIADRNTLLQDCLRPEKLPFNIDAEYPTVLTKESVNTSYCMYSAENKIVAHASLWIRDVVNRDNQHKDQIGLVGNVATCQQHRGKGYMALLLKHLEKKAKEYHLSGLILWSDLGKFYQKLGFQSLGVENRILLKRKSNFSKTINHSSYDIEMNPSLNSEQIQRLLDIRPKTDHTLHRTPEEFKSLLKIPYCDLFIIKNGKKIESFFILGKGYDMMGVIHEWGKACDDAFSYLINSILIELHSDEILILSPQSLEVELNDLVVVEQNRHPMAWIRYIDEEKKGIYNNRFFIWGLDSI